MGCHTLRAHLPQQCSDWPSRRPAGVRGGERPRLVPSSPVSGLARGTNLRASDYQYPLLDTHSFGLLTGVPGKTGLCLRLPTEEPTFCAHVRMVSCLIAPGKPKMEPNLGCMATTEERTSSRLLRFLLVRFLLVRLTASCLVDSKPDHPARLCSGSTFIPQPGPTGAPRVPARRPRRVRVVVSTASSLPVGRSSGVAARRSRWGKGFRRGGVSQSRR
jgi:hypothetical protein